MEPYVWSGTSTGLDLFLTKPVSKQQPWIRNVLRISLYQLRFMDRIPAYACVDDAVKLATRKAGRKLAAVVNGGIAQLPAQRRKGSFPGGRPFAAYGPSDTPIRIGW